MRPLVPALSLFGSLLAAGCERRPQPKPTTPATTPTTPTETTTRPTTDEPPDTASETPGRPALSSPARAPDLDPAPDIVHVSLTAAPHAYEVGGAPIDGMAYEGQVPGPTIRARVGDTVVVDLQNDLPDPTTIHWHGVDVPIEMDGAGWPMPMVAPGEAFQYRFVVEQPGTFWYHPHLDTERQVDLGLYGAFVVEDPADPPPDEELVVVLDTFGEPDAAEADPHLLDTTLADWAVNGLIDPVYDAAAGAVVRVRMINVSNTGYVDLPARAGQTVIAHDQGLLAAPEDEVVLGPGDRAELEWRLGGGFDLERRPYTVAGGPALGDPVRLFEVATNGAASAPAGLPWPHSGAPPSEDPGRTDIRLLFSGAPERGWEINGETFPEVSIPRVDLDEEVVIEVRNVSPAIHPFHLHGHAFEVLSTDGVPPAARRVEDTVDVPVLGIVRLLLVADNPGTWMMHCHILPHADDGMMTLLDVGP